MPYHLILNRRDKKNALGVLGHSLRPSHCAHEGRTTHLVYPDAELASRAAAMLIVFGFAFRAEPRE